MRRRLSFILAMFVVAMLFAVSASSNPSSTRYVTDFGQFGRIAIQVSSVLAPQSGNTYGAVNLHDGNINAAWCEGRAGDGIGEYVEFSFDHPIKISTVVISNGYGKSNKSFLENNRIKKVRLTADGGASTDAVLQDTPKEQSVRFSAPVRTKSVKLTILDVYKGSKYQDTCISDMFVDLEEHNYDQ